MWNYVEHLQNYDTVNTAVCTTLKFIVVEKWYLPGFGEHFSAISIIHFYVIN